MTMRSPRWQEFRTLSSNGTRRRWIDTRGKRITSAAHDPGAGKTYPVYWLYALSNLGSLLGLFAYPVAIERLLSIRAQSFFWSAGFIVFCCACAWAAMQIMHLHAEPGTSTDDHPETDGIGGADMAMWILLSCTGTGLLLAITNELCQDVAVVPLLWIVPLGPPTLERIGE